MMTGAVLRGGGGGCGGCGGCGSGGRVLSSDEQHASARQSAFRDPLFAVLKLLGDETSIGHLSSMSKSAMFTKDFLAASLSKEELTKRLKAVLEETGSWPQGENTDKLKFIAKDIGDSSLQKHASFDVRLLVACIAADILRVFAPDAPYDRTQLQSIFSLFLSSFYQLCNPTTLPRAFYLLERLVSVKAFSLAAAEEISEDMLENLLATVSSICQKGVVVTAESLLADCIVDFTEECNESSMSTMVMDTFFEPISTCKNFDTNQNARVFSYTLQRSPALQDAASQYLFDLKQKIGIESDLRDNVIDIIAAIAPIAPKSLTLVMPALADDLKFDDSDVRSKVVSLLGKIFSSTGSYVSEFPELLKEFLGRINDKLVSIRTSILSVTIDLVKSHPSTMADVCAVLLSALNDGEEKIRKIALNVVCENFKLLQQSGDANILKEAGKRMRDKKAGIRKEAMQLFASIYQKAPVKEREGNYGWIVNTILGNARDTDSSDVRGEVDGILDEKFLLESSSPSTVFTSVAALLTNLDDAGFAGLEHLLNNKARIASELRRACLMVSQSTPDPSLLASCIKNLASFLPESLKAAEQLEAVFAYSSIKIAPKLLECLDVVHDSSELRKRKRDLDKKFGPRSSLQDFLDELFIHFQIGLFDCRWVQGLLSSVSTHDITPFATKLTKIVLTSFPKTASACNVIILDCIQGDKFDSSVALRAVHANAESFRGNTKLTNATKQLCVSLNHKIAKLASRAYVALEGQVGADTLVKQMKANLDLDERCVAALSVLQQCAIMFPASIMQHGVDVSRFVVEKLASHSFTAPTGAKTSKSAKSAAASSGTWLAQAKVIGIKLLGILSCCVKDKPDVAKSALEFYREIIKADGSIGDAETTEEFKAESRLECGKAVLRIAACPDISSYVSYADVHLVAALIEDVESSVKKPYAKHLYKSLITRKTGATLPWRFAAIFALAANDSDRDFAAQVLLLLKQTVAFMRTMYRRAAAAGTVTAAHLLPERILPMVVHLLAHHPEFVDAKTSDADRSSIAKKDIGSVMEALASGPEHFGLVHHISTQLTAAGIRPLHTHEGCKALVSRNATMLSKLCLKELEVRSSGKVWENSTIRLSVTDIIEPSLFIAAAAAASSAAGTATAISPFTSPTVAQQVAAPKARVLGQIQNASPALFKALAPSPIVSAAIAAGKKQARLEPVFDEPASKRPARGAMAPVQPAKQASISSSSENSLSTPSSKASARENTRTPPTKELAFKQAVVSPVGANASSLRATNLRRRR